MARTEHGPGKIRSRPFCWICLRYLSEVTSCFPSRDYGAFVLSSSMPFLPMSCCLLGTSDSRLECNVDSSSLKGLDALE